MLAIQCLRPLAPEGQRAADVPAGPKKTGSDLLRHAKEGKQGTLFTRPGGSICELGTDDPLGEEQVQDVAQLIQLLSERGSSLALLLSVAGNLTRAKDSVRLLEL